MEFTEVNEYLGRLSFTEPYDEMVSDDKEKVVFTATEVLRDEFGENRLTPRAVALQTLYMLEGEDEDFSKYKRHGVESFSTKGVSISFKDVDISPSVLRLMGRSGASVGRLI